MEPLTILTSQAGFLRSISKTIQNPRVRGVRQTSVANSVLTKCPSTSLVK